MLRNYFYKSSVFFLFLKAIGCVENRNGDARETVETDDLPDQVDRDACRLGQGTDPQQKGSQHPDRNQDQGIEKRLENHAFQALAFEAERKELTHSDLRFSKERADRNACHWCEKRDLNPYGEIHTPLKRARLPVPPLSQNAWAL